MYSDFNSILDILPGMPQTTTSGGYTATSVMINSHIVRADNIINSKIANRYNVSVFNSIGSAPPLLISLSEDIASYYTYRSQFSSDNQNVNEWIDKFKDAIEMLDMIRNGEMDLVNSVGSIIGEITDPTVDLVSSNTEDFQSFFDEDDSLSWKVDEDKKDEIDDAR